MKRLLSVFAVFVGIIMCFNTVVLSQVTQEWVSHFDGMGDVNEKAYAMSTDAAGNTYVTGSMPPTGGTIDNVITMKLNEFGTIVWRKRYAAKYGASYGKAIAVDGAGNVYVAGYIRGISNGDFLLIKYSPDGDTLWTRQRNGTENGFDDVAGMVITASGDIWVTGQSGFATTDNIMTVIYDANGNELAMLSYTVSVSSKEHVNAIFADANGNVYLTGYTYTSNDLISYDALTLKYSSVGSLIWAKVYNGVTNNYDIGNKVTVDLSGNVYVTGVSTKNIQNLTRNAFTIKYTASGDTAWVRRYDGGVNGAEGNAIITDAFGNAYMTGTTKDNSSAGVLLVKYNSAGDTVWTRVFNGNGSIAAGKSIGFDISGNIFVGGLMTNEFIVLKYSASGNKLWNQSYRDALNLMDQSYFSMTISPSGNTTLSGTSIHPQSDYDIAIARLDSSGVLVWESIYQSTGNSGDYGKSCAVSRDGNLFLTGTARFDMYEEIVTIKFDQNGDTLWARRYGQASGGNPRAMTVDKSGNVYVAAFTYNGGGYLTANFVTLKYDPNGTLKWATAYDNGSTDYPEAIAVDDNGNVYITGESVGSGGNDYVTLKYDSMGVQQWFPKRYNPSGTSGNDVPFSIAVDKTGNVYVTGSSASTSDFYSADIATIKYNSLGVQQWVKRYSGFGTSPSGAPQSYDKGAKVAIDDSGNVYVGGTVSDNGIDGGLNIVVIKYNALGDTLWTVRYDGPAKSIDQLHDLALDREGNIIVTGASAGFGPTYDYDYITIKFNKSGVLQWADRYDDGNNGQESAESIVVDSAGNSYVTGSGLGNNTITGVQFKDIVTIRYSPTGTRDWEEIYDGSASGEDLAGSISIDHSGNVYIAGASLEYKGSFDDVSYDMLAIKYHQEIPLSVQDRSLSTAVLNDFVMYQNYPNPFNPSTTVRYDLPSASHVSIKIYNLLGQQVANLIDREQSAGTHETMWNAAGAAGLYFYRIDAVSSADPNRRFTQLKKMVLVK